MQRYTFKRSLRSSTYQHLVFDTLYCITIEWCRAILKNEGRTLYLHRSEGPTSAQVQVVEVPCLGFRQYVGLHAPFSQLALWACTRWPPVETNHILINTPLLRVHSGTERPERVAEWRGATWTRHHGQAHPSQIHCTVIQMQKLKD